MARITMRLESRDLRRLQRQLNEVPEDVQRGAKEAVAESAETVRKQVERTVRVWRGKLKDRVRVREIGAGLTADVGWFDDDTYYAQFQEFGTSSIEADPVLTTAAEEERARFVDRVRREVREELG